MKNTPLFIFITCLLFTSITARAQNFKKEQQRQESIIKVAHKKHKVSEKEYGKLMNEQDIIKETIAKYTALGWTPHEKNVVNGKLDRAARRLKRYETNGEKY